MNRVTAIIGLGVVVFAVTLATYVGTHLSNEAISILTGAACGVGVMLPATIIGILALLRRRETQAPMPTGPSPIQTGAPQYPPVIVVAPPALPNASASNGWQGLYQSGFAMPSNERQFSVIGEEEGAWNEYRHR